MHGSSIRLLAAAFEPYFKLEERLVLVFAAASGQKLGEHSTGEHRQSQARFRWYVLVALQQVNGERLPVVTPNFTHTQRCVNRKLGQRVVIDIYLDHDIRWRVVGEVKQDSVPDTACALHIEASVGF